MWRWYRDFPYTPHSVFLTINILHEYVTCVTINEAMLVYYYSLKSVIYSNLLCLYLNVPFLFQGLLQNTKFNLVVMSSDSSWLWQFIWFASFWWLWQFWGVLVRYFVEWFTIGICLTFFLWLERDSMILEGWL